MNDMSIVTPVETNTDFTFIAARSERQAMDWSLVLASQSIPTAIERLSKDTWALVIDPGDSEKASESIRQYCLENRRWKWEQPFPWSETSFHWGSSVWGILITLVFQIDKLVFPSLASAARFDSTAAFQGEWWRFFTATLLHADLPHLTSNVTTGFVLLGLAMASYGAGCGLLAAYLAGAAGNLGGLLVYQTPYHGLGASGMVMGALGLISALSLRRRPANLRGLVRGVLAGLLLLVILGTNPASDVVAHVGGFVMGLFFGAVLVFLPGNTLRSQRFQSVNWLTLGVIFLWTGWCVVSRME